MKILVNDQDITSLCGDISLESSAQTLGLSLSFSTFNSSSVYLNQYNINEGDIVKLMSKSVIFLGIIVTKNITVKQISFTCYDFGFYLNKSKIVIQFNNIYADEAIKILLGRFSIPIGEIPKIKVVIDKIYYDKEVSEIIKDLLNEVYLVTQKRYFFDLSLGVFNIISDIYVDPYITLSNNTKGGNISAYLSDPSKSISIENMKNSVTGYTSSGENIYNITTVSDVSSIKKYGLLSETISIEDKDIASAKHLLNNKLTQLNKKEVTYSFSCLGDFSVLANRIIYIKDDATSTVGNFRVKSASHTVSQGVHTMNIEVMYE